MKNIKAIILMLVALVVQNISARAQNKSVDSAYIPKPYVEIKHPEWSKNAVIYQVNIRQYTPQGTFKAFEAYLPKLKEMGVDILWIMPINPIGIKNRKGTLGSEYSIKDYYAVNPEFGTMAEFKELVNKIHSMGMHVILDWVANHSAWDNQLATDHPDWYTKTPEGNFQPTPWYDWTDVIDFDSDQPGLRKYMTDVMKFWVKETDIDGFRCDVAGFIPVDFWDNTRRELDHIKPVFMLAEWESRDLHKKAFDMTYSWSLYDDMHKVTIDHTGFGDLVEYFAHDVNTFPDNAYRMTFTENHDKNAWTGTALKMFGDGAEECAVLTCVVNGMPLVYSGQEAGNTKQLRFFDKDTIQWKSSPYFDVYKTMFALKHRNQALWNGSWGGEMERIFNDKPDQVLSFVREKNGQRVLVAFNFSDQPVNVKLQDKFYKGSYTNVFTNKTMDIQGDDVIAIDPWKYVILEKK